MSEAEKIAKKLVEKFIKYTAHDFENLGGENHIKRAKQCALIHVKDTLKLLKSMRATKQIMKQYRLYIEVKVKIEEID